MLSIEPLAGAFLRVRADGVLTPRDYDSFERAFAAELEGRPIPVRLLLDLRPFRGWSPGGLIRDLRFDLRHRRTFGRIAVLGDKPWHRWTTHLAAPVFRGELKYFAAHQEGAATAWLSRP